MIEIGETKFFGTVRVHRYHGSVRVRDLANGGKRGKVCPGFAAYGLGYGDADEARVSRVLCEALGQAAVGGYQAMRAAAQGVVELEGRGAIEDSTVKGVRVPPADFETVQLATPQFVATAEWESFHVSDPTDFYNEQTLIAPHDGKVTACRKFYRFLVEKADELKGLTFGQLSSAMRDAGIRYHYYCAVD